MSGEAESLEDDAPERRLVADAGEGPASDRAGQRAGCGRRPVLLILGVMAALVLVFLLFLFSRCIYVDGPVHKQKRTVALLAEIEGGLDNYKIDHGTFPINPAENRGDAAIEGARVLYRHLSGDYDLDGEFDAHDPEAKVYVDSLDYKSSTAANRGTVGIGVDGHYMAIDSYGNPIRYLCDPPNRNTPGSRAVRTNNPTYDLWSIGKASADDDEDEARGKWITNWGAQ